MIDRLIKSMYYMTLLQFIGDIHNLKAIKFSIYTQRHLLFQINQS